MYATIGVMKALHHFINIKPSITSRAVVGGLMSRR